MNSLTGSWIGYYQYDSETESETEKKEYRFKMQIEVVDDDISGMITDIVEDDKENPGTAKVSGFVDEGEVSFIKQYPALHYRDKDNKLVIDESQEHPEIHYHGTINGDSIEGNWDFEQGVALVAGQYYSNLISGTWKVSKVN